MNDATGTAQSVLLVGRRFEVLLVLAAVTFVAVGTRGMGQPLLVLVIAFGAVLLLGGLGRPAGERRTLALGGILTLLIAIPINRLTGVTIDIAGVIAVCLALAAAALAWSASPLPRGWLIVALLSGVAAVITAISPDQAALLRFAPYVASFLPAYVLFGQAKPDEQRRVLGIVLLAAVLEGALATAEPALHFPQLWAPAQLDTSGQPVTLKNPLLFSLPRSQGTLGHPLPLGILLAIGVGVLVRATRVPAVAKGLIALPLVSGLVFSGSRNSVLIAVLIVAYFALGEAAAVRWVATTLLLVLGAGLAIASGVVTDRTTADFEASGSVTHRSGALDAFASLLTGQPVPQVLTGNGWASTARLFSAGLLQTDGFGAVDNELVLLFAQGGVVCLGLLIALIVRGALTARAPYRPLLLAVVVTLFVFDMLVWPASAALCGIVLAACVGGADVIEPEAAETSVEAAPDRIGIPEAVPR